ncbi:MAG: nucleoside deaminase [Hyphomicrobiales bacterium]|nr:MAG: nucleoside deaminase [Hyphomicrobiales bacterium]
MPDLRPYDLDLLRQSFAVARRAREGGDHPFGSVLADRNGKVIREQENGYSAEGGDRTAHAEKLLATWAGKNLSLEELADCTLYTSTEPCAMCSGAIYWAGIGRVVFGQTEHDLKATTGAHEENPTLDLPCHIVFNAGQRPTEVVGPLLAEESAQLHADYWKSKA